jgi:hypothetical protein
VFELFGNVYLREPNMKETQQLLSMNEKGVSRNAWKHRLNILEVKELTFCMAKQYLGHVEDCTSYLRTLPAKIYGFCVLFFGMASSHNNLNVLHRSPIFAWLLEGDALRMNYEVVGHPYNKGYYLADGIYTEWPIFVKKYRDPKEEKYKRFAKNWRLA